MEVSPESNHYAFASDNAAGICPQAWAVLAEANDGTVGSYGDDRYTAEASERLRALFEYEAQIFFVFNGTAANALALSSICHGYHAVICHEKAHVMTDECGAPELFTGGSKLIGCPGEYAKLTPEAIQRAVHFRRDLHFPKCRALTITQATEFGTVYTLEEIRALTKTAHNLNLSTHMDGARFANAVARLGCSPAEMTWKSGIDILSLGFTKLGGGLGEAVIVFDDRLAIEFDYRVKRAGQLASKMRLITAPWCGMLRDGAWLELAKQANGLAQTLRSALSELSFAHLLFPTEANAVFAKFPEPVNRSMAARGWHYYELAGVGDSRLMCSWATTQTDIERLVADLREAGRQLSI